MKKESNSSWNSNRRRENGTCRIPFEENRQIKIHWHEPIEAEPLINVEIQNPGSGFTDLDIPNIIITHDLNLEEKAEIIALLKNIKIYFITKIPIFLSQTQLNIKLESQAKNLFIVNRIAIHTSWKLKYRCKFRNFSTIKSLDRLSHLTVVQYEYSPKTWTRLVSKNGVL